MSQPNFILFYSIFCRHCDRFRKMLESSQYRGAFKEICIDPQTDPRTGRMSRPPIPGFVRIVPTIVVSGSPLAGNKAFAWLSGNNGNGSGSGNVQGAKQNQKDELGSYNFGGFSDSFSMIDGSGGTPLDPRFEILGTKGNILPNQIPQDNYKVKESLQGSNGISNYSQNSMSRTPGSLPPMSAEVPRGHLQNSASEAQMNADYEKFMQERNSDIQRQNAGPRII